MHCSRPTRSRQNSNVGNVGSLASVVVGVSVGSVKEDSSQHTAEKGVADSGATYHVTRSADVTCDIRPTNEQTRVGDCRMIDVVGIRHAHCCFAREPDS